MSDTPLDCYLRDLQNPDFVEDPAQRLAVEHLQRLYEDLIASNNAKPSLLARLGLAKTPQPASKGLYFWGGVGRGKTYLVDMFFECLPFTQKRRIHFHRFMQRVHSERKLLRHETDPMSRIAAGWAKQVKVLCFDEFVVHDVADAVILVRLLDSLLSQGVVLVATSNVEARDLYKGGLQRDLFLPAIDLIYQYCEVVNIDSGVDYRLRFLTQAETYFAPLSEAAERGLSHNFDHLAPDQGVYNATIEIEGRELTATKRADGVIWFEFDELCDGPRSQNDYLELARCFHSILLANVPLLTRQHEDQARRFINLVDVLYDHNVKLIVSAAMPIDALYQGTRNEFEFKRTVSRLHEMRSHEYLALAHITA